MTASLYSSCKIVNNLLYTSGQLPLNPKTSEIDTNDVGLQTQYALSNIKSLLASNGYELEDIMRLNLYITNMNLFDEINVAYKKFFENIKALPPRTAVGIQRLPQNALIEIECVAYK